MNTIYPVLISVVVVVVQQITFTNLSYYKFIYNRRIQAYYLDKSH